mmetsp:Transcript_95533/g.270059  ORF Transcript_95533/g.270059 Transcript_95533/m.270059 type:complete len:366 (+) Transcript_95533:504-1601(+)
MPLVGREGRGRGRLHRGATGLEQGLRSVDTPQHVQRLLQQHLCLALVGDGGLELLLLQRAVLRRALPLPLQLGYLSPQAPYRRVQARNSQLQAVGLRLQCGLRMHLPLSGELVLAELCGAPVPVLDFELLLPEQVCNHVVDGFFHAREGVEAYGYGQRCEARRVGPTDHSPKGRGGLCTRPGHGLQQRGTKDLAEQIARVVRAQKRDGLGDRGQLRLPSPLALLPFAVGHGAPLTQFEKERLVRAQGCLRVLALLLRLRKPLFGTRTLLLLVMQRRLSRGDLVELGSPQGLVGLLGLKLLALRGGQVSLEGCLHLPENAKDFTRARLILALEARRCVVVAGLRQGRKHTALVWRDGTLEEHTVPQ